MSKAKEILRELDEEEQSDKKEKGTEGTTEGVSSKGGHPPHTHTIIRNEDGEVFEHGEASDGPPHEHQITEQEDGSYLLESSFGRKHPEKDGEQEEHTHTVK